MSFLRSLRFLPAPSVTLMLEGVCTTLRIPPPSDDLIRFVVNLSTPPPKKKGKLSGCRLRLAKISSKTKFLFEI